jgi:hypothetical protein
LGFLNVENATFTIPHSINKRHVKTARAIVYFRESHGGFQSCFTLKAANATSTSIPLFCEEQVSDNPMMLRGGNDWLGTPEGGVLGDAPAVKVITLETGVTYEMQIHGNYPEHNIIASSIKTNVNDPVFDNDASVFTFYEETRSEKVKVLGFKHPQPGVSTIMGFEDEYVNEKEKDYNDIILEMCLKLEFDK